MDASFLIKHKVTEWQLNIWKDVFFSIFRLYLTASEERQETQWEREIRAWYATGVSQPGVEPYALWLCGICALTISPQRRRQLNFNSQSIWAILKADLYHTAISLFFMEMEDWSNPIIISHILSRFSAPSINSRRERAVSCSCAGLIQVF